MQPFLNFSSAIVTEPAATGSPELGQAPAFTGVVEAKGPLASKVPDEAASPALGLESISLSFGGLQALTDVSLSVAPGEIRAIIGPNGAGKSSLINVISGIYRPDDGRVFIRGRSFRAVPTQRLAALGISRTFQNLALFKGLSAFDNIALGTVFDHHASFLEHLVGLGRARRQRNETLDRAQQMLEFFGLTAVRDRLAGDLPYGIQKRVELARALVSKPQILLLDEPMAGVTVSEKQELVRYIRAARDELGTTVVLIEHDIGIVMGLSDRVTVLEYGRKIADGTPAEVRVLPAVVDAYLGATQDEESGGGI